MAESERFAISYGRLRPLLHGLGMGPAHSGAVISDDRVKVHMGWAFRATVPRSSITGGAKGEDGVVSIGVHGWRGRWLVNGASTGIVRIDISPTLRAHMMGIPVHLHELRLSLEDPDGFLAALAAPAIG